MIRFLLQSLAIPAIQVVFDLCLRALFVSRGGSKWDPLIYFTGFFACWALSAAFLAVAHLSARAGLWPGRLAAGTLAFVHTFLLATNFFLFRFFGEYLFPGAVAFLTDPHYMLDYVRTFGGVVPVAVLVAIWWVFYLCLRPWGVGVGMVVGPVAALIVLAVTLPGAVYALNRVEKLSEYRLPPDMVAVQSLSKHFLRVRAKVWPLRPSLRVPVEAPVQAALSRPRTVLVILNESMGVRSLDFMEHPAAAIEDTGARRKGVVNGMPRLSARMQADSGAFVVFQRGYSNSMATQVSMASIFSGVSPEESHRKLHCMPMMWDLAKAAGYRTGYFSSQRLRWASMSDFLLNQPIDSLVAREQTDHPPVNDMGIDDFHIVETLETWLAAHPDEPLFMVWNTNALHVPFQAESQFVDLSTVPGDRYEKALYLIDTAFARVFAALERAGRMDDALIVNTADHGEDPDPAHPVPRIHSFYEEFIRIPLWVKLPRALRGKPAEAAMRRLTHTPVANVDITPTLAHLWGARRLPTDEKLPAACLTEDGRIPWAGVSLFDRRASGDRVLVALSNNDTRRWDDEGFGLVRGPWRMILWPRSGRRLYDAESDPAQLVNLWDAAPDSVMAPFHRAIASNPWLKRIYDHHEAAESERSVRGTP
jgi:arylsulfatase A-like enzyme